MDARSEPEGWAEINHTDLSSRCPGINSGLSSAMVLGDPLQEGCQSGQFGPGMGVMGSEQIPDQICKGILIPVLMNSQVRYAQYFNVVYDFSG